VANRPASKRPVVYVLACADGSLYTGWTVDLAARLRAHRAAKAAKYTRGRLPVELAGWFFASDASEARRREAAFKALTRDEKLRCLAREAMRAPWTGPEKGRRMTTLTAPSGDELWSLRDEARTARIRIHTAKGDIVFKFFAEDAPLHSAAFIKLTRAGFYDGLNFHRVEPGFVIQGGDPNGDGTGGPGYRLDAEFNENPHHRGVVAMARSSNPNSAGSQFYITLDEARFLDKQYTVFGEVTEGMDVVDAIRRGDVMEKVTVEPA